MDYRSILNKKSVVITGATGFIGNAVLRDLRQLGAEVTAVLRTSHGAKELESIGANVLTSGLEDRKALVTALGKAQILFNFAYDVRASGVENLAAFDTLMAAAKEGQVARIVHASSIVVYDDWLSSDLTETSPISTVDGGPYRQTKIAMERKLQDLGISCAILQPTIVHGPGSALWTDRILQNLRTGPVVLPKQNGTCNAVDVKDVSQAALRAAAVDNLGSERFIVSGPATDWHSFYKLYQSLVPGSELQFEPLSTLTERLGPIATQGTAQPSRAAMISKQARRIVGRKTFEALVSGAKRLTHRGKPHYPDRSALELLTGQGICNSEKAKVILGYEPELDPSATIERLKSQF